MFFITALHADDPLGRFELSSLPYVDLVELLVAGFENPDAIRHSTWGPQGPTPWDGLSTDASGSHLYDIMWPWKSLQGSLCLKYIPATTKRIDISMNALSGTIDLTHFPKSMNEANLSSNNFVGSADLTNLPEGLVILNLMGNALDGTLCLTALPHSLRILYLSENSFTGPVSLARLPADMHFLNLEKNSLSGSVDFLPLWKEKREVCINLSSNTDLFGDIYRELTQTIIVEGTKISIIEHA
mmetsp:Transcript_21400/g.33259  ORF Transcript_21400/g.33259 Transcript_21400/m.33259 type:complete len:242 (-) Transcript_21400:103-828(-)